MGVQGLIMGVHESRDSLWESSSPGTHYGSPRVQGLIMGVQGLIMGVHESRDSLWGP
jgi:hypothetical protein